MSTSVFLELRPEARDDDQQPLPLATEGVLRCVWDSKFGAVLIEVIGDEIFVNGARVERAAL